VASSTSPAVSSRKASEGGSAPDEETPLPEPVVDRLELTAGAIEVFVHDESGRAVAGARVTVYRDSTLGELDRNQLLGEGLTSEQGSLVLERGDLAGPFCVAADEAGAGEALVRAVDSPISITLHPAHAIEGVVVDAEGRAIFSALVQSRGA